MAHAWLTPPVPSAARYPKRIASEVRIVLTINRVVLVTPPYHSGVVETAGSWPNAAFVYLAGCMRAAGLDPVIYDAMTMNHTVEDIGIVLGALVGVAAASFLVPPMLSWYTAPGGLPQGAQIQAVVQIPEVIRYATTKLLWGQAIGGSIGAAAGLLHRPVILHGHWLAAATVYLDNRQMNGRPGFYVLTPLQLDDRPEVVLVQRGWAWSITV